MESKLKIILPALLMLLCIAGILLLNRQSSSILLDTQQSLSLLKEQESALSSRKDILDSYQANDAELNGSVNVSPVALKYGGQYSSNLISEVDQFNTVIAKIGREGVSDELMAKMEASFLSSMLAIENIKSSITSYQTSQLRYLGAFSTAAAVIFLFSLAYLILYVLFPLQEAVLQDKLKWTKLTSSFQGMKGKIQAMSYDLKQKNQMITAQRQKLKANQGMLHRIDIEKKQLEHSLGQLKQEKAALNTKLSEKAKQHHALSLDLEKRNSSLKELAQNTQKVETEYHSLKQEVVEIQSILSEKNEKLGALTAEIKSSSEAQAANAELNTKVASLDTECGHLRRSITKKEMQIEEYESKLSSNNEQIGLLNKEVSEFQMQSRVLQQERSFLQNRLESKNVSVDNLTERLEDSKKRMEIIADQNRELLDKNQRLETFISDRNTEISDMKDQLRKAEVSAKDLQTENESLKNENQLLLKGKSSNVNDGKASWVYNIVESNFSYSDVAAALLGNTQTQLSNGNNSLIKHLHPESKQDFQQEFKSLKQGVKKSISGKWKLRTKEGEYTWAYIDAYRHTSDGQDVIKGVIRDLSEVNKTKDYLRDLSLITNQISDAIMIVDYDQKIEWVNNKYEQLSGYKSADIVGKHVDTLYKDFIQQYNGFSEFESQFNGGLKQHELLKKQKSGQLNWVMMTVSPLYDEGGKLNRYLVVERDIDQLKKQQEKLTELSVVAEKTDNFAAVIDPEGHLIWNNHQFADEFGVRAEDKTTDFVSYLQQKGAPSGDLNKIREAFNSKRELKAEFQLTESNEPHTYSFSLTPQVGSNSEEFLLVGKDVTFEKSVAESYKKNKDAYENLLVEHEEQTELLAKKEARLETALKELEKSTSELEMMNLLADRSNNLICITDEMGHLEWANKQFEQVTGYQSSELEGAFVYQKLKGDKTDHSVLNNISKSIRSSRAFKQELFLQNKRGEDYYSAIQGIPVLNEEGEVDKYLMIGADLTIQKEAEERLENLTSIADQITNAVLVVDADGEIRWVNKFFTKISGQSEAQLLEKHIDKIIQSEGEESFSKQVIGRKRKINTELSLTINGSAKWYSYSLSPIESNDFDLEKYLIVLNDIDDKVSLKAELSEAESRLQNALNEQQQTKEEVAKLQEDLENSLSEEIFAFDQLKDAPVGVALISENGTVEQVNREFCKIYGIKESSIIDESITKLYPKGEKQLAKKQLQAFFNGKKEQKAEITIHTMDGEEKQVVRSTTRLSVSDEKSKQLLFLAEIAENPTNEDEILELQQEIADLKKKQVDQDELLVKEQELQRALEESQNLSLVASKTDNAVIITSRDGGIEYVNAGFERITGYKSSEVIGKKPGSFLQGPDTDPEHVRAIRQGLNSRRPFSQEILNYSKDGRAYWLSLSITPILDVQGNVDKFIAIERDITAEKEKEDELKMLSLVASKTDNAVVITDRDGAIEYVNEGFERITEYRSHEVIGKKPGSFLQGPDTSKEDVAAIRRGLNSGKPFKHKVYNYSKSGRGYWLSLSINPIFDDFGQIEKFIAIESDITEQIESQAELEKLSLVASQTDNAVIITDKNGSIEWANEGFERITEYRLEEVIGKKPGSFLQGPKTRPEDVAAIRKGLNSGQPFTQEVYNYSKTGREYWLQLSINPILDDNGNIEKFIAIETDITDRKQLEEEIRESEEQLRSIMDSQFAESEELIRKEEELRKALELSQNLNLVASKTDNAVIITDAEGRIQYVNPGFERITGYGTEEVMGKKPGRLLQGADTNPDDINAIREGLKSKKPFTREILNYTKSGIPYWLQLSITPILDDRGNVEKFIAIENDITERKKEEDRLKNLSLVASQTDNAVIITDKDGLIIWANEGFERITEYTLEEVQGKKPGTFLQGDETREEDREKIRQGLQSQQPFTHEIYNYSKSGRGYWLSLSITPIFDKHGKLEKFVAIESDITDRKQLEDEIRESEDQMRSIMDSQFAASEELYQKEKELQKALELSQNLSLVASKTDNAVIISTGKGEIQYVNEGFERITGYKAEEVMGKKPGSFLQGPDTNPSHVQAIRDGLKSKKPFTQEILNYSKRGVPYWLQLSITPILDEQGNVEKFIAIESDITEKKAEEEQMEALSIVASKTDNAVIITDKDGKIEWVNDGFVKVTEYTLDEVVGKKPGTFLQGEKTDDKDRAIIREKLDAQEPFSHEIYNYSKSGRGYWLQLSISPIFDDEGNLEKFIAIESDVTERKELEEELKNSENEMRGIMDAQFEAQEQLIKKEQELNKALDEEKKSREELDNTMERLKNTQTQMVQNEKMASIGQLTAGIAHEINNPINFVYNGIDSLKMSLDDLVSIMNKYNELSDTDDTEAKLAEIEALKKKLRYERLMNNLPTVIDDIKTGANRTIEIVKGLRVFSRLDEEDQKAANINECLDSTLILLRNKTKDKIKVKKFYDQHVGEIMCYPGQLNQVFMNLMTNAIQAIPEERNDGELMIYTENLKDSVIVRILDNGSGIPEDVRKRIFEPFYTTKAVGIGTGLGLSISYGIIEKHEGKIYVNSEVGKGTEFVIELPKEASLVK